MKETWIDFKRNFIKLYKDIKSKDKKRIQKQIPNIITITRGVLAPLFILIAMIIHSIELAFAVMVIFSLTDSIDGNYARKHNLVTEFGALLDTICDKLFIFCMILPVIYSSKTYLIIILILEFIICVINTSLKFSNHLAKTSILGKIKTIVLDTALVICYFCLLLDKKSVVVPTMFSFTILMQVVAITGYIFNFKK